MNSTNDKVTKPAPASKGPTIVVGGVTVSGPRVGKKKGRFLRLSLLSLLLLGSVLFASAFLSACAGSADLELRQDGSVSLGMAAALPGPLADKLRKLSSLSEGAPLFDVAAARRAAKSHPKLTAFTVGAPGPDAYTARIEAGSMAGLLAEPALAESGAITLEKGQGWTELRLHLARGRVESLLGLVPGLDQDLIGALSPPALDPEPISRAEYHSMLRGILGEKALASLDAADGKLSIEVPGKVLSSSGGRLEGRTLKATIPFLDILVLEKPIDLSIRWASD